MAKKIQFDIEARDGLKRGVDALADAVKVTLGYYVNAMDAQYKYLQ